MLTTLKQSKSIDRLLALKKMETDGTFDVLPKKEVSNWFLKRKSLKNLGGIVEMKAPAALFIVDPKKERTKYWKPGNWVFLL